MAPHSTAMDDDEAATRALIAQLAAEDMAELNARHSSNGIGSHAGDYEEPLTSYQRQVLENPNAVDGEGGWDPPTPPANGWDEDHAGLPDQAWDSNFNADPRIESTPALTADTLMAAGNGVDEDDNHSESSIVTWDSSMAADPRIVALRDAMTPAMGTRLNPNTNGNTSAGDMVPTTNGHTSARDMLPNTNGHMSAGDMLPITNGNVYAGDMFPTTNGHTALDNMIPTTNGHTTNGDTIPANNPLIYVGYRIIDENGNPGPVVLRDDPESNPAAASTFRNSDNYLVTEESEDCDIREIPHRIQDTVHFPPRRNPQVDPNRRHTSLPPLEVAARRTGDIRNLTDPSNLEPHQAPIREVPDPPDIPIPSHFVQTDLLAAYLATFQLDADRYLRNVDVPFGPFGLNLATNERLLPCIMDDEDIGQHTPLLLPEPAWTPDDIDTSTSKGKGKAQGTTEVTKKAHERISTNKAKSNASDIDTSSSKGKGKSQKPPWDVNKYIEKITADIVTGRADLSFLGKPIVELLPQLEELVTLYRKLDRGTGADNSRLFNHLSKDTKTFLKDFVNHKHPPPGSSRPVGSSRGNSRGNARAYQPKDLKPIGDGILDKRTGVLHIDIPLPRETEESRLAQRREDSEVVEIHVGEQETVGSILRDIEEREEVRRREWGSWGEDEGRWMGGAKGNGDGEEGGDLSLRPVGVMDDGYGS